MLNDSDLARRDGSGRIELRAAAMRVSWQLNDLATSDGHTVHAIYSCAVRALPDANDQKMLEETFLASRPAVGAADVSNHFERTLRSAAASHARTLGAEELLAESGRHTLVAALRSAGEALAFSCGIELLPPNQLDLECPSLGREQFERLERQTAQRRAAEQVDHLRRSGELFDQFQKLRAAAPELSPGQVLGRLGLGDQADALRSLLVAAAHQSKPATLWAVAGPYLVQILGDKADSAPEARLINVPADLGPLRSVQGDGAGLLLGCRGGVMRFDPTSAGDATLYQDPRISSQLGFNAVVRMADRIWASHGEAGVVAWRADQPDQPEITIAPQAATGSARNLIGIGNRLAFSAGSQIIIVEQDGRAQPPISVADSPIAALFYQPGRILSVHEDGAICVLSGQPMTPQAPQHRAGRISAAGSLPWLGDLRLLLATEDGPILCTGVDDELITQYCSPHRGVRIVAAASNLVAAVSSDRQRLILWNSWDGRAPCAELHLYSQTRHRIADIAFG
jgi:hypothetical protein